MTREGGASALGGQPTPPDRPQDVTEDKPQDVPQDGSLVGPQVTVLVVSYRHAEFVEQCLDSIRGQTLACRIVLVDDCSPDDTVPVVRAWMERTGEQLTLIAHDDNRGLGASLAEGLALVDTEFVAYIAADDWMEPHRMSRQVGVLRERGPQCALAYSDCYRSLRDGVHLEELFSQTWHMVWRPDAEDVFGELLRANWIPAPTMTMRTAALRAVGGYDPDLFFEDLDVCLRLARDYDVVCVEEPLATHRELEDSLGAREFTPGAPKWRLTNAQVLAKHLDLDARYAGAISAKVYALTRGLYREGVGGPQVATLLRQVARTRGRAPMPWAYAVLAALRVPGRWVTR